MLWHGTHPANILSILKSGLVLNRAKSGGNHGAGVYFSDRYDKSLGYAYSGKRNNNLVKFLFLADVAAGNIYYGGGKSLSRGYDSLWYGKSGYDSQVVVYEEGRANLVYLCEISTY
jgi:hypothetical protein